MKIVVLNGSPRVNGTTSGMVKSFVKGAQSAGHSVEVVQVGTMKISGCTACEYCHGKGDGECAIKDDMQKVYEVIADAEMIVFASPVYYWSFSGQMQSTITRFYALGRPAKTNKYAMILSSASPNVYNALKSQFNDIVSYFGATNVGIVTAFGGERTSEEKHAEIEKFGASL